MSARRGLVTDFKKAKSSGAGEETTRYALSMMCVMRMTTEAQKTFEELKKISPEAITPSDYHKLLTCLVYSNRSAVGDIDEFSKTFTAFLKDFPLDIKAGNLLLKQLRRSGSKDLFENALDVMNQKGVAPDATTMNEVMMTQGTVAEAKLVMSEFREKYNILPNGKTLCALLRVCQTARDLQTVEQLISIKSEEGLSEVEWQAILRVYVHSTDYVTTEKVVQRMISAGKPKTSIVYELLIGAAALSSNLEMGEMNFKEASKKGFAGHKPLLGNLMACYAVVRDADKAQELLEHMKSTGVPPSEITSQFFDIAVGSSNTDPNELLRDWVHKSQ